MTKQLRKLDAEYNRLTGRLCRKIAKLAERELIRAVVKAHKRNGGKYEVVACSAMGRCTMDVYGPGPSDRMPPIVKRIDEIYWDNRNGIPAAPVVLVKMMPHAKRPTVIYDW